MRFILIDKKNPGVMPSGSEVEIIGKTNTIYWIRDEKDQIQWAWPYELKYRSLTPQQKVV